MLIPVVLSGGAGTRLWPVSREGHPKSFMKMIDGETLLAKTYKRAASVAQDGIVFTVTNRDYFFASKDIFSQVNITLESQSSYILEPFGRNTAPAIALTALKIEQQYGKDTCILVLPADQLIQNQSAFHAAVTEAKLLAEQNYLVTFGIQPDKPETGFGYIELLEAVDSQNNKQIKFVEKPDSVQATKYLESGRHFWNSGIFCFKAETILKEFELYASDILQQAKQIFSAIEAKSFEQRSILEITDTAFAKISSISIDYAVLEYSKRIAMVPGYFDWNDVGSWSAISQLIPADEHNNRTTGETLLIDTQNTFIQSEDRLVATLGVRNLMIIDTSDALLVTDLGHAQDVKLIAAQLKQLNHETYKVHKTVIRPWGSYTILGQGPRFKIKRIEVHPGATLSLQMHYHRSEHWIVVSGSAKVTNGDQILLIATNESTYIPVGHKHRLENPGRVPLILIEVQNGEYLHEDDIVRFEDVYGRS